MLLLQRNGHSVHNDKGRFAPMNRLMALHRFFEGYVIFGGLHTCKSNLCTTFSSYTTFIVWQVKVQAARRAVSIRVHIKEHASGHFYTSTSCKAPFRMYRYRRTSIISKLAGFSSTSTSKPSPTFHRNATRFRCQVVSVTHENYTPPTYPPTHTHTHTPRGLKVLSQVKGDIRLCWFGCGGAITTYVNTRAVDHFCII